MKIAIITAMLEEQTEYKDLFSNSYELEHNYFKGLVGQYKDHEIINIISGIGKANSASGTTYLLEKHNPDLIINIGTCGGLKDCKVGDIILSQRAGYIDVDLSIFNYKKGQMAGELEKFSTFRDFDNLFNAVAKDCPVKTGTVCTIDSFVNDKNKLKDMISLYDDAICVEMEATAIAQIANHYKKSVLFIKKISDLADSDAGDNFTQNVKATQESFLKTIKTVLNNL